MKSIKRIASLLLALVMALAMSVIALAAENTGSITVENPADGVTYTAYKVFDVAYNTTTKMEKLWLATSTPTPSPATALVQHGSDLCKHHQQRPDSDPICCGYQSVCGDNHRGHLFCSQLWPPL